MSYTLCVIDMQYYFGASRNAKVQNGCKKAIRKAMRDDAAILFVEYATCGRTVPTLVALTYGYKMAHLVIKTDDDGSGDIIKTIQHMKLPANHIKICGVNTDYCVLDTTRGLKESCPKSTKIEVIADACNSNSGCNGHEDALYDLKHIVKVSVLNYKE